MHKLIISKDLNSRYIQTASNNERLSIIAEVLLDEKVRNFFYNTLNNIDLILANDKFCIKNSDSILEFEFNQKKNEPGQADEINNISSKKYIDNVILIRTKVLKNPTANDKLLHNIYFGHKIEVKTAEELQRYYETNIPKQALLDLIIKFEELMNMGKDPITLSAEQDNFSLN